VRCRKANQLDLATLLATTNWRSPGSTQDVANLEFRLGPSSPTAWDWVIVFTLLSFNKGSSSASRIGSCHFSTPARATIERGCTRYLLHDLAYCRRSDRQSVLLLRLGNPSAHILGVPCESRPAAGRLGDETAASGRRGLRGRSFWAFSAGQTLHFYGRPALERSDVLGDREIGFRPERF
jgi:hypothetical protein